MHSSKGPRCDKDLPAQFGDFAGADPSEVRDSLPGAQEIRMDTILKLEGKETIHDCVSPGENPWELPVCPHCGQVAYRIVIVAIDGVVTRKVPLCGRHFVSACLQAPALNRYNRAGKIG
jgi:hypothetical protein